MRERSAYRLAFAIFRMPDRKPGVDTRIAPAGGDVPDSATRSCHGQGRPVAAGAERYRMSVSFGRITQNSFPSGSASTVQDSSPVYPMSARCAAGQVEVHAVLDCLRIGDRHEAHADGRVPVRADDDLALTLGQDLPAERLGPEPR
jgi:hypothetical protein